MPPVEDHEVHEKVKVGADFKYGCWSRGEFSAGYYAPDRRYRPDGTFAIYQTYIPHVMSQQCRNFYLWDADSACKDCAAPKDTEYAERMSKL